MCPTLEWKPPSSFVSEYKNYDYIVLTTDDDRSFSDNLIHNKNVICIDHHYSNRRPAVDLFFHIATRPFIYNYRKWGLPCYPVIQTVSEKVNILRSSETNNSINIAIVGGNNNYQFQQINRLSSSSKICLHFISRNVRADLLRPLQDKFTLCIHENISTSKMNDILKLSKYIMSDSITNTDHINGMSMSGSVPLAFSNLNILILSSKNNELYKFKSAQTFAIDSNEPIEVNDKVDSLDIEKIYEERNILIQSFHSHMNDIMQ